MNENRKAMKRHYEIETGANGFKFVLLESVDDDELSLPYSTNSKIGKAMSFSFPIEYTCRKDCECYKLKKCYGCGGCYTFGSNQEKYTRNYKFYLNHGPGVFIEAVVDAIKAQGVRRFRWFAVGDIPDVQFVGCMAEIARQCPETEFWAYTKKYGIVNKWIDGNGMHPENLVILFSHWMNEDGSYLPMDNKYNLPTSEFVPFGMEEIIDTEHGHVCPCSDPEFVGTCAECEHPCSRLKLGEHMYLLEHSTKVTKARDKMLHESREAIKARNKETK